MDRNCEKIGELLPLFAGGELDENEMISVNGHLSVCAECAQEAEEYAQARRNLALLRDDRGGEVDVWSGVSGRLFPAKKRTARLEWAVRYAAVVVMGLGIGFLVSWSAKPAPEKAAEAGMDDLRVVESDSTPLGGADFAGSGTHSRRWLDFKIPENFFPAPGVTSPSAGFVLPVVEKVHEEGERSF